MVNRFSRRAFFLFFPILCLFAAYGQSMSGEITTSVSFSLSDLQFSEIGEYDALYMVDCDVTRDVSEPQLPVKLVHVALPIGAEVEGVEVVSVQSEELDGTYRLYPVQPPQPYGEP